MAYKYLLKMLPLDITLNTCYSKYNCKNINSYHNKYFKVFIHLFDIRITFMKTYLERFINYIIIITRQREKRVFIIV